MLCILYPSASTEKVITSHHFTLHENNVGLGNKDMCTLKGGQSMLMLNWLLKSLKLDLTLTNYSTVLDFTIHIYLQAHSENRSELSWTLLVHCLVAHYCC